MPSFTLTRAGSRASVMFADGGMNLLSSDALGELAATMAEAVRPCDGIRLVTFGSSRSGLFAAGADMNEMQRFGAEEAGKFARSGQRVFASIEKLQPVTVALIDGDCFGGALDLAMAFDLRFATPRARFSHPGARIGIVTGFGGTSRWRKLIDRGAARTLFIGNSVLTASEAMELGLVDRVAQDHEQELARLEALDPATTRFLKELAPRAERIPSRELDLLAARLWDLHSRS